VALHQVTEVPVASLQRLRCPPVRIGGDRIHLQDGPIDLVMRAWGDPLAVPRAYACAANRFQMVLPDLVSELGILRQRTDPRTPPAGDIAARMWRATRPHLPAFITPMAAVAGSVADEIADTLVRTRGVTGCFVNNGGDIAVRLLTDAPFRIGIVPSDVPAEVQGDMPAVVSLSRDSGIGGIASSGWSGRSHSLGIADTVTVLAADAAAADTAATLRASSGSALSKSSRIQTSAIASSRSPLANSNRVCARRRSCAAAMSPNN